jgi:hypothetical protein
MKADPEVASDLANYMFAHSVAFTRRCGAVRRALPRNRTNSHAPLHRRDPRTRGTFQRVVS